MNENSEAKRFDMENWPRKNHFDFFMAYDDPYFGITANVDVGKMYDLIKKEKLSFFLASLFYSTRALNQVENFRMRLDEDGVLLYDRINAGSTIFNDDATFTFAYFEMKSDLRAFCEEGEKSIEKNKNTDLFDSDNDRLDMVYYSVIPWISFTTIKHPVQKSALFSIPKITFGKFYNEGDKLLMPVSVEAHHSLADGYHVGQYFEKFQRMLNHPEKYL